MIKITFSRLISSHYGMCISESRYAGYTILLKRGPRLYRLSKYKIKGDISL
jgi:hypothetical protein